MISVSFSLVNRSFLVQASLDMANEPIFALRQPDNGLQASGSSSGNLGRVL